MPFGTITKTMVRSKGSIRQRRKTKMTRKNVRALARDTLKKLVELKHFTITQAPLVNDSANIYNAVVTNVPQAAGASTDQTRIGDQITVTSLHFKVMMTRIPDLGNLPKNGFNARVIVYQYKPNNALLAPNVTRLLVNGPITGTAEPMSHQQIDFQNDYHILYDSTKRMTPTSNAVGALADPSGTSYEFWNFWVPLKRATKKIQYDAGNPSHNNAIYIAVFNDSLTGSGAIPLVSFQSRLRFMDS